MTLVQRFKKLTLWNKLGVVASIVGIVGFPLTIITLPFFERARPRPHFVASIQIGDDPAARVFLTNDFLTKQHFTNKTNYGNGDFEFGGYVNGCLVIPVRPEQTNQVFTFILENDSSIKVNDLEIAVGFPKDWNCGLDSTKWHELLGLHLTSAQWKFEIRNLQYWSAQSPYSLSPSDSLHFPPITNFSIPIYRDASTTNGLFQLSIRSTGFENLIAANILFFQMSSNFFEPFLIGGEIGKNGRFTIQTNKNN